MNLRTKFLRVLSTVACATLVASLAGPLRAQSEPGSTAPEIMQGGQPPAPMPSPPATANVAVAGATIRINYHTPHLRGRHLGTPDVVPYGQVWRTGANPATSFVTTADLMVGALKVPAGSYTLYTLPEPPGTPWLLILNKQTGQWGTEYKVDMDLGRTPMMAKTLDHSQEAMTITFENVHGHGAELHVRWAKVDEFVNVELAQ
jgi:Protein of unknown function (DUF2911)